MEPKIRHPLHNRHLLVIAGLINADQAISTHSFNVYFHIRLQFTHNFSKQSTYFRYPNQTPKISSSLPCVPHAPPSSFSLFDHPNNIWSGCSMRSLHKSRLRSYLLRPSIILGTLFWKTSSQRSGSQANKNVAHPCPSRRYTNTMHDEELPWNNRRNTRGEVTRTFVPNDEVYIYRTHFTKQELSWEADVSYAGQSTANYKTIYMTAR